MNSDGRGWATHRVRSLSVKAMLNLASRFTNDVRRHAGRSDGRAVMLSVLAATGSESGAVISFVMSVRCFHDRGKELELRAGRLVEPGGIEPPTSDRSFNGSASRDDQAGERGAGIFGLDHRRGPTAIASSRCHRSG